MYSFNSGKYAHTVWPSEIPIERSPPPDVSARHLPDEETSKRVCELECVAVTWSVVSWVKSNWSSAVVRFP
jgi:hypothetical protein